MLAEAEALVLVFAGAGVAVTIEVTTVVPGGMVAVMDRLLAGVVIEVSVGTKPVTVLLLIALLEELDGTVTVDETEADVVIVLETEAEAEAEAEELDNAPPEITKGNEYWKMLGSESRLMRKP